MKISKPKVSKLNTGSVAGGAYGMGRAGNAGQIRTGHHFHNVNGGGDTPNFSRGNAGVNSGWADARKRAKKMF